MQRRFTGRNSVFSLFTIMKTTKGSGWVLSNKGNELLIDVHKCKIKTESTEKEKAAVMTLIDRWDKQIENQILSAFVQYYIDEMKYQWGPDDEEEQKEYWPDIQTPEDLLKYTGLDCYIYALAERTWEHYNGSIVILSLNCPWDEHGWAAIFRNGEFIKVDEDVVDTVWI